MTEWDGKAWQIYVTVWRVAEDVMILVRLLDKERYLSWRRPVNVVVGTIHWRHKDGSESRQQIVCRQRGGEMTTAWNDCWGMTAIMETTFRNSVQKVRERRNKENIIHRICCWSRSDCTQMHRACYVTCFEWLCCSSGEDDWFALIYTQVFYVRSPRDANLKMTEFWEVLMSLMIRCRMCVIRTFGPWRDMRRYRRWRRRSITDTIFFR